MYTLSDLAYDLVWCVPDCTTPVLKAAIRQEIVNWHVNGWPEPPPAKNWQLEALAFTILATVVNDIKTPAREDERIRS